MQNRNIFATPVNFDEILLQYMRADGNWVLKFVEKQEDKLIVHSSVTDYFFDSQEFGDESIVYVERNCYIDGDFSLDDGQLIIDGDLWVKGSIELSSDTIPCVLQVKGDIYCTGSIIYNDDCSISARNVKINNCLIMYSDSVMDVKESLYVGGVCVGIEFPSVGKNFYGAFHEI